MKADGEPCAKCGSPMAGDQRYCLNCGERRGEPRVDYRARTPERPAEPVSAPESEPAEAGEKQRDYAPLAAVGGIAVLGLMLLIGVLIGRGDGGDTAPAPAPVVVQGGGAAAGGGGEAGAAGGGTEGAGGLGTGSGGGGAKQKNANGSGKSETAAEAGAVTASEDQLEELQSETGEAGAKNALKLPDKIATPGAPPPIDKSKAPGGGEGGAVTIE